MIKICALFFASLFLFHGAFSANSCQPAFCGGAGPPVRFPFWLNRRQGDHCGHPQFALSCNDRNQMVLTLPSGEFKVNVIDYANQLIHINSVDHCPPKQILNFSLSGSPFTGVDPRSFTFFNCSEGSSGFTSAYIRPLCLSSSGNYTILAVEPNSSAAELKNSCRKISTVSVPVQHILNPAEDLLLTWSSPNCRSCEIAHGTCGFKSDTGREIGCSNHPNRGLPRTARYGIIIGAGIPGLVCLIGIGCYIGSKIGMFVHGRFQPDAELSIPATNHEPTVVVNGLDGPTIDSYPKMVLGESRRLPKPNDGTCPICLAEYQPKETLRTIPECNHYFHTKCIDEWLGLNATCPVCRCLPPASPMVTPSLSVSLSSSSAASSSSS